MATYDIISGQLFRSTLTRTVAIISGGDLVYLPEATAACLCMMGRATVPNPDFSGPLYKDIEELDRVRPSLPEMGIMEWDGTINIVRVLPGGDSKSLLEDEDVLQVRYEDGAVHAIPYWRLREMAINPSNIPLKRYQEEVNDGSYW